MAIPAIVSLIINIIGIVSFEDAGSKGAPDDEENILKEANKVLEEIRSEYPSKLAGEIKMRIRRYSSGKIRDIEYYSDNIIIDYLELGTGIHGPYKTPIYAKGGAMHFESVEIAAALGFPTSDVFLKKTKGIKGRYSIARGIRRLAKAIGGRTYFNSDRLGDIPVPRKS